jgi:hypothetical protein
MLAIMISLFSCSKTFHHDIPVESLNNLELFHNTALSRSGASLWQKRMRFINTFLYGYKALCTALGLMCMRFVSCRFMEYDGRNQKDRIVGRTSSRLQLSQFYCHSPGELILDFIYPRQHV